MVQEQPPLITTREGRGQLQRQYLTDLVEDTLPFWVDNPQCVDRIHGGFVHCLDRRGEVLDTDKGMWVQGRFTWLLARIFNGVEARDDYLDLAHHGLAFIEKHGFDTDGRMFYKVTRDGQPLVKRRYVFTEMFTLMAMAEVARATGSERLRDRAEEIYGDVRRYLASPGMLEPKINPDVRAYRSIGIPMIMIVAAQTLRSVAPDSDTYTSHIDGYIREIKDDFVRPELEAVVENVNADGTLSLDHFDGRILNPGHALEAGWFILVEAAHRADDALIELGTQIIDWSWKRGWDSEFGGLLYYRDVLGMPVTEYWHDMKFWWPHNEGIIATLLAYEVTGDPQYAAWHQQIHDWAHEHFPDPRYGEWYGYLHRDGRISSTLKGNMWKGPFHLPRMQLTCHQILNRDVSDPQNADGQS